MIRVSHDLKAAIHASASANKRSVNSELLFMLERAYMTTAPNDAPPVVLPTARQAKREKL